MNPRVSVIVPNYNYARFLDQRITSVLDQTYQNFELILLDDASTDDSQDVLSRYADNPHVTHLIINQQNTGNPFIQWRRGLSLAQGEYVWIAESDDWADIHFLEEAVRSLDAYPEASLFFPSSYMVDVDNVRLKQDFDEWAKPSYFSDTSRSYFSGRFVMAHYLIWGNCIYNASGTVFRKNRVKESDWDDVTTYHYCGDWCLWSKLALRGGVVLSGKKLNYFRQHKSSTTIHSLLRGQGMAESMRVIKQNLKAVSFYRRMVCIGTLYRGYKKGWWDHLKDFDFLNEYRRIFKLSSYYSVIFERINKLFLPVCKYTISRKRDQEKRPNTNINTV